MDAQRLLVLSDIHDSIDVAAAVLRWAKNRNNTNDAVITAAVFLGDGLHGLSLAESTVGFSCDWKKIRGNSETAPSIPTSDVFDFGGHRFFLCHGHQQGIYSGYGTLIASAHNAGADAALFGHTHVPFHKDVNGLLLVNPGSIGRARSKIGSSFALIECLPGEPLITEFWRVAPDENIQQIQLSA
jgi:putative phosphoesterase